MPQWGARPLCDDLFWQQTPVLFVHFDFPAVHLACDMDAFWQRFASLLHACRHAEGLDITYATTRDDGVVYGQLKAVRARNQRQQAWTAMCFRELSVQMVPRRQRRDESFFRPAEAAARAWVHPPPSGIVAAISRWWPAWASAKAPPTAAPDEFADDAWARLTVPPAPPPPAIPWP